MILRSLKLENIRSYTNGSVVFPEKSIVLSGDIGSGKSTILLAIEFALFGLRSDLTGSQLLRHGAKQGSVELEFTLATPHAPLLEVRIKRCLKRTKDSIPQEAGWIAHKQGTEWAKTEATPIELKTKILELLGYPSELLTKSKSFIYRFTVYTPQEQMKQILAGSGEERLDTIRKIFGIDTYARVQANAILVGKELRSRIRQESIRTEGIDADKRKYDDECYARDHLLLRCAGAEHELNKLHQQTETLKQQHAELFKQQTTAQQLGQQAAISAAKIGEQKQQICSGEEELKNLSTQHEKMQQALREKKPEPREALDHERQRLTQRRKDLTATYTALVGKEHQLTADINRRKTTLDQVTRLRACPLCQQDVSEEHKHGIAQRELPFIHQTEQELLAVHEQKQQHEQALRDLENQEQQLRNREKESILIETAILRLQDIDRRRGEKQQLLAQLQQMVIDNEQKYHELVEQTHHFQGITEQFQNVQKKLDDVRTQERRCAIMHAELKKEIENRERQMHQLEETINQKEALRKKLHRTSQIQTWLDEHLIRVAGLIEKEVLRTVYGQFDELFRNWFSMLVEDELLHARLGDDFSVAAEQNGYETTIENLSGGEKTAVALAYRLALNKVINDVVSSIRTKNLLILDEPTDGFSEHQLDNVRNVLRELNAQQIIMVSHEQKIESFVDHVIRIEKLGHESVVT